MRVLLAGASGAVGLPLISRLRDSGHVVTGIHRAAAGDEALRAAGASPVRVDVLDRSALLEALDHRQFDAVIAELTALKKPPTMHRGMVTTDRLRSDGTSNLLEVARRSGAGRFVTQSIFFGYGFEGWGERVLTETDPFAPKGRGQFETHLAAMRANEDQVLGATELEGIALRYGLFYGPGPAGDGFVEMLRRRRLPAVQPAGVRPWLYIEDAADATLAALERGKPGRAYNVVDDEPISFSTMIQAIAGAVRAPKPFVVPRWMTIVTPYARSMMVGDMRLSNALAKSELGWEPAVSNYRAGVARMATHYSPGG